MSHSVSPGVCLFGVTTKAWGHGMEYE